MVYLKSPRASFAFLFFAACLAASAPYAKAQRCNKSPDDIQAVRDMKDVGSDFVIVVAAQSTIYAQPDAASKALLRVKRSDFLALVKRDPVRSWHRVIEIDSATEGWINECDVVIKLTTAAESGPPLEQERVGTTEDPELNVSNLDPSTKLNLRLNGTLYVIPANTTKTFTLKPGKYEFYGYSPGIRPAFGNETFQLGIKYSWSFRVVRQ